MWRTCRAFGSKCGPVLRGAADSAARRCPPRSSRSAAAIAGRPKAASRRKSRRVVWLTRLMGRLPRSRSIDEQELIRVEQHETELLETLSLDERSRGLSFALVR